MKQYKSSERIETTLEDKGKRLDSFVEEVVDGCTRSYIKKLVDNGDIIIEGKSKIKAGNKLKGTETVIINLPEDEKLDIIAEDIPIDIVYEDEYMVVLNKEPNTVVHPAPGHYTGTLVNAVMYHIKDLSTINGVVRPGIVHRLDKDTSGVIIIAKSDVAHLKLTEMFKEKVIKKTYVCIIKGTMKEKEGRVETLIGRHSRDRKKMAVVEKNGKNAITNYKVISESEYFSLLEVGIETGRTHQIRVHMKHLHSPILGDETYGKPSKKTSRQMLHALKLELNHPITGEPLKVVGELPQDFKDMAKTLKLDLETINK